VNRFLTFPATCIFLISFALSPGGASEPADGKGRMIAEELWRRVQGVQAVGPLNPKLDPFFYCADIRDQCEAEFYPSNSTAHRRKNIEYFVDQFGKHGPQADIRWLMSDLHATIPGCDYGWDKANDDRRERVFIFNEYIVRRALADPKFLDRYYRAVFWSESLFGSADRNDKHFQGRQVELAVNALRDRFPQSSEYYWCYARNFVLLAHAFGRDDLLSDTQADDLASRFDELHRWFVKNEAALTADPDYPRWVRAVAAKPGNSANVDTNFPSQPVPNRPFADWTGPVPPRLLMRGLVKPE
jgi:hypothetical protein